MMIGERIGIRGLIVVALSLVVIGVCLTMCTQHVHARDLGQWENTDPKIREWYRELKQPDNPIYSCCGEADAYEADDVEVGEGGRVIAIVTDTRPDAPRNRRHIAPGTRFEIPPNKMIRGSGNPTGHAIIFINTMDEVLCFVTGTLS